MTFVNREPAEPLWLGLRMLALSIEVCDHDPCFEYNRIALLFDMWPKEVSVFNVAREGCVDPQTIEAEFFFLDFRE